MECNPAVSSVHNISQARILEWVGIFFSRGFSQLKDQTHISCIGRWILYYWTTFMLHIVVSHSVRPSLVAQSVKNLPAVWETGIELWIDNPLQYSCLENPHGQRSLVGYSPWGHRDLDMAKRLSTAQYYTYTIYDIYIIYHIISVVDKYCYMFVRSHRMLNTKSEF